MSLPPLYNERILLRELAGGKEHAFRQLYDYYAKMVYSIGLLHLKQVELSEDIVQSVFLTIWDRRDNMENIRSFAAWLHTLTRNTIISILRRQGAQVSYINFLKHHSNAVDTDPEQELLFKEWQQLIWQGIDQLSVQQRTALSLQREEGLNYKGIGNRMGISPNTVRVHLLKAMQSLRRFVQTHSGDPFLIVLLFLLPFFL